MGQTVNLLALAYGGSNPSPPTSETRKPRAMTEMGNTSETAIPTSPQHEFIHTDSGLCAAHYYHGVARRKDMDRLLPT